MEPATHPTPIGAADDVSTPVVPLGHPEQIVLPLELPASDTGHQGGGSRPTAAARASSPPPPTPAAGDAPGDEVPPEADGTHDRPIGFALTARARRAVAPGTLPELSVVGVGSHGRGPRDTGALEEPDDTRPARARALRRAGVPVTAIVRQLGADPLAVTAWVGEVGPSARHHRTGESATDAATADEPTERRRVSAPAGDPELEVAARLARAAAAEAARQRLGVDPDFGVAIGLLAATASTDPHAVTITASDARQVARVLHTLIEEDPEVPVVVRVIVRVGPELAGDLVRHRVAGELGVDPVQVSWTRWRSAPRADAVQLLVRVAEPSLAATVAGWIDVALEPTPQPLDIAF